jgi:zinc transport system substrate-binding protein
MLLRVLLLALPAVIACTIASAAPRIVVSIPPIHSLVANVTAGVGEPALLLRGGASPHDAALRPSQARLVTEADIVVWVGPSIEGFLARPIAAIANGAEIITLERAPGVRLLPARRGGLWAHEHDTEHNHASTGQPARHEDHDGHIWLDPDNASAIVEFLADRLSAVDPVNAARYRHNAGATTRRLGRLAGDIEDRLQPVKQRRYLVFHDAYQYFENRFGTAAAGAVSIGPDRKPGARRLLELREFIRHEDIACLFREPQFEPALVRTIVEGTGARIGVLDPMGSGLPPGPNAYFDLMQGLAGNLAACLAR